MATFLILALMVRDTLVAQTGTPWSSLVLPALLGVTWSWYAPHNIVIASCTFLGATLWWWRYRRQGFRPLRLLAPVSLVFAVAVCLGATQLGTFLPLSLREDVGTEVFLIDSRVSIRPYTEYMSSPWTNMHRNIVGHLENDGKRRPRLYEDAYQQAAPVGRDEVVRSITWAFENHLWAALRIYCFPLLGLFLFWRSLRSARPTESDQERRSWQAWLLLSLLAFATGFAVSYGLELDGQKWLLTRFLVPGSILGLMCLACATLRKLQSARLGMRLLLWGVLLVVATLGPVSELTSLFCRNHLIGRRIDPLGHRLNLLVQTKGPYLK